MAGLENKKSLLPALQSLPETIQEWLGSDGLIDTIGDMNQRLHLDGDKNRIIPRLILRLAVQDLNPRDFTGELKAGLQIDDGRAREITQEITERVFQPMAGELRKIGVDIELLHYEAAPPSPPPPLPSETPPADGAKAGPPPPATSPPSSPEPFILHEELQQPKAPASGTAPVQPKPSFSYQTPLASIPKLNPEGPRVKVERVVHYSSFSTPIRKKPVDPSLKIKVPRSKWFV